MLLLSLQSPPILFRPRVSDSVASVSTSTRKAPSKKSKRAGAFPRHLGLGASGFFLRV